MTDLAPAAPARVMPWLVRGDLDGFFGLALDNLAVAALFFLAPLVTEPGEGHG